MYSQNNEDYYILEYFKNKNNGTVLEIGAYNPTVFSNSRALIEKGWNAVLVEASPKCYKTIFDFYKDSDKVEVVHTAIGTFDGDIDFYDSEGANATAVVEHYNVWKNVQMDYYKTKVPCMTWRTFFNKTNKKFDFISIDTEGMDFYILNQIDFDETETSLLCIEYSYNAELITKVLQKNGFNRILNVNGENILVARRGIDE